MKHSSSSVRLALPFLLGGLFFGSQAFSQWSTDPNINTTICAAQDVQDNSKIASDGAGGAIIVWQDRRGGSSNDLYAQRIDRFGYVRWTTDGVPICTVPNDQFDPEIIPDGTGGAIITWDEGVYRDIYAQRVDSSGVVQWTVDGVPICTAPNQQSVPNLVSDGAGGAIIAWDDNRNGTDINIYAQRINNQGIVMWAENGIPISTAPENQGAIVSDGAGGAIIAWNDRRNVQNNDLNHDIYAQRVNGSGVVQWTSDGVAICTASRRQESPTIASDMAGGAIIAWDDYRDSTNVVLYAQRIDVSGNARWSNNGIVISPPQSISVNHFASFHIINDSEGGVIIAWSHLPTGGSWDIHAQRIDTSGVLKWSTNGVVVWPTGSNFSFFPQTAIVSDDAGGAIIVWEDYRSGNGRNLYAQRVNSAGGFLWNSNGVAISTADYDQLYPRAVTDGASGAIITWSAYSGFYVESFDIYAQQVGASGTLGQITTDVAEINSPPPTFRLNQNYPNPFNPATTVSFGLPSQSFVSLKVFDALGREVSLLISEELPAGMYSHQWNATGLPSGVYFYRMQAGSFIQTRKLLLLR